MKNVKVPISVNLIGKNVKKEIDRVNEMLKRFLLHPGDEVVFVDTGSSDGSRERA